MKTMINLSVSKSVTQGEWERVCQEAVGLLHALFLEKNEKMPTNGIDVSGLFTFGEQEKTGEKGATWYTAIQKQLRVNSSVPDTGDAMLGRLPAYLDYSPEDPLCQNIYSLFKAKSQPRVFPFNSLTVASLVEDRLGEKAFLSTEMSFGQCKSAVERANRHLANPIRMPAVCNLQKLWKRIKGLPLDGQDQVDLFIRSYIGNKNAEFGIFLREHYSQKVLKRYWKKRFGNHPVGTAGFEDCAKEYLAWGFSVKGLLRYAVFEQECSHHYEELARYIMGTGIYLTNNNLVEVAGLKLLWPQRVFASDARFEPGGSRNKTIDRYVPLGELYDELLFRFPGLFDIRRTMRECFDEGFLE